MTDPFPLVQQYGLPPEPDPVDLGWMRRVTSRTPSTIDEVLARGLRAMEEQDLAELQARDPVAYYRVRRQRRTLLALLLRR